MFLIFSFTFILNFFASVTYLDRMHLMNETEFYTKLLALPNGANNVMYLGKRYLLIKETLLEGKLLKVYAERLDEIDVVSTHLLSNPKRWYVKTLRDVR